MGSAGGGATPNGLRARHRQRARASLERLQLDVAEVDLGPLGLEEDLSLRRLGAGPFVDRLAVDRQLDGVALAGDLVLVPLAQRLLDAVPGAEVVPADLRVLPLRINRQLEVIDQPEVAGVVGPNQGSKARDVLIKTEADLNQHLGNLI